FFIPLGRSKTEIILDENNEVFYNENYQFQYGKANKLRLGNDATIIATGVMVEKALKVYEILKNDGINVSVWNFSCISEISENDLTAAASTGFIFIYEDHNVNTGLGSIIATKMVDYEIICKLAKFGVTNYGASGINKEVYGMQGLDVQTVAERMEAVLQN
ncbi:MAG: transketolase, partial [Candidatus Cloacimonetes bacterium]|nr:transketolase [Candidatus Cloacimonadota bacterium]